MKNYFISKKLYTTTEQSDEIMNCDHIHHQDIYDTIAAMSEATTEQVCMPFSEWVQEDNNKLAVIGAMSPGEYIKRRIMEEEGSTIDG